MPTYVFMYVDKTFTGLAAWSTNTVVSFPPATEETGAMGRYIESRYFIPSVVAS
jgi:hypothetical protein